MLVKAYGLFWHADEIHWFREQGSPFELLGRRGKRGAALQLCDFRPMQGIYILYGHHGPYYVGLTERQGLGKRIKDHHLDRLAKWDRFSWFGFNTVLPGLDERGYQKVKALASNSLGKSTEAIRDVEALLIHALGCAENQRQTSFQAGKEWSQVKQTERDDYLAKIARRRT